MPVNLITRAGKGSPLSTSDHDANMDAISDAITSLDASVAAPAVVFNGCMVHQVGAQTLAISQVVQVHLDTVDFDINSDFNVVTYTHTPTTAGYWEYDFTVTITSLQSLDYVTAFIYKNGSVYTFEQSRHPTYAGGAPFSVSVRAIMNMNGTTDYATFYVQQNEGSSETIYATNNGTRMTAKFLGT